MSLVGPRQEVPKLVDLSDPFWQEVLCSRPGITDPITLPENENGEHCEPVEQANQNKRPED